MEFSIGCFQFCKGLFLVLLCKSEGSEYFHRQTPILGGHEVHEVTPFAAGFESQGLQIVSSIDGQMTCISR